VAVNNERARVWSVELKAQAPADATNISGAQLISYLKREGIKLADFERSRVALEEDDQGCVATTKRIRNLERELARKEKARAEAAVLPATAAVLARVSRTANFSARSLLELLGGRGSVVRTVMGP
jgi:hypothetical protein